MGEELAVYTSPSTAAGHVQPVAQADGDTARLLLPAPECGAIGTLMSSSESGDRRWWVYALCAEHHSAGVPVTTAPLGHVVAQIELAYAERYGWRIVGTIDDQPPYTHRIAVRSWDAHAWHFLAHLEEQP